jgi:hypothetical protein
MISFLLSQILSTRVLSRVESRGGSRFVGPKAHNFLKNLFKRKESKYLFGMKKEITTNYKLKN